MRSRMCEVLGSNYFHSLLLFIHKLASGEEKTPWGLLNWITCMPFLLNISMQTYQRINIIHSLKLTLNGLILTFFHANIPRISIQFMHGVYSTITVHIIYQLILFSFQFQFQFQYYMILLCKLYILYNMDFERSRMLQESNFQKSKVNI